MPSAPPIVALEGSLVDAADRFADFYGKDLNHASFDDLMTVPRLGEGAKDQLQAAGITDVKKLVGMFLVKGTKDAFEKWLVGCGVQKAPNQSGGIAIAINNWCGSNEFYVGGVAKEKTMGTASLPTIFVDSAFRTKVEFEASLKLPPAERASAEREAAAEYGVSTPISEVKKMVDQLSIADILCEFYNKDLNHADMDDLMTVPRLDPVAKTSLEAAGIISVNQLIGMFLVKGTKDAFEEWLVGCGVLKSSLLSGGIAIAIDNWCGNNGL